MLLVQTIVIRVIHKTENVRILVVYLHAIVIVNLVGGHMRVLRLLWRFSAEQANKLVIHVHIDDLMLEQAVRAQIEIAVQTFGNGDARVRIVTH